MCDDEREGTKPAPAPPAGGAPPDGQPNPPLPATGAPATSPEFFGAAGVVARRLRKSLVALVAGVGSLAEQSRKILTEVLSAVLLGVLLVVLYQQIRTDVLYVESIPLPEGCEAGQDKVSDLGRRLVAELVRLQTLTGSDGEVKPDIRFYEQVPNATLATIPLRDVIGYLRHILPSGSSQRIMGEVVDESGSETKSKCAKARLRLTLSNGDILNAHSDTVAQADGLDRWDRLVHEAAIAVLQNVDPCSFSQLDLVLWSSDHPTRSEIAKRLAGAEAAAAACLASQSEEKRATVLNKWVRLLDRFGYSAEGAALYAALGDARSVEVMIAQGDILWRLRRRDEAKGVLEQAAKTAEDRRDFARYARVQELLGLIAYDEHDLVQAIRRYRDALDKLKGVPARDVEAQLETNLGNALRDQWEDDRGNDDSSRADQICKHFDRAILLAPRSAYAHNGLGRTYEAEWRKSDRASADQRMAMLRSAQRAYALAGTLDPSFWEADNNLARVYAAMGEWDAALWYHGQAAEDKPDAGYVYVDWAMTLVAKADGESNGKDQALAEARRKLEQAEKYLGKDDVYVAKVRDRLTEIESPSRSH